MSRFRSFTLLEALAEVLREAEDEFLLGDGEPLSDGDSNEGEGLGASQAGASSPQADGSSSRRRLRAGLASGATGSRSTSSGDPERGENRTGDGSGDESHYLDETQDVGEAARRFAAQNADVCGRRPTGDDGDGGVSSSDPSGAQNNTSGDLPPCGCNQRCLEKLSSAEVADHRLQLQEMEKVEKEMLLMGVLSSVESDRQEAFRGKRKRAHFKYAFQGQVICASAFRYVYDVGVKHFKNLLKHMHENGIAPRLHGNLHRRPRHALAFSDVEKCAQFISSYAERFGLPFPAPLHGRGGLPPTYLPASTTYKAVHAAYTASCRSTDSRAAGLSVFRNIWRSCFPHICIMPPRADVCHKCEKHRQNVCAAVDDADKVTQVTSFAAHIAHAQREREFYRSATVQAFEEFGEYHPDVAPPYAPCSQALKYVHYTFDFAQQVSLPHMARQPGPLYFKTPRKVQLFGVCSEGVPKQVNYLLDEADTIGPNGTKSHGANTVVSLLHDFFLQHGHGEEECVLHADNCAGQNKNRTVMAYLAWRVVVGLHKRIRLCFMIAGHTRCLVDGCFGLLKRKYRRSDVFTLEQLAEVVDSSADCNVAQPGDKVNWYQWDKFFEGHFKPIPKVSQGHHFVFSADKPGVVVVSDDIKSPTREVTILKSPAAALSAAVLPEMLPRGGLTEERKLYLFREIREFVPAAFKDELCPAP